MSFDHRSLALLAVAQSAAVELNRDDIYERLKAMPHLDMCDYLADLLPRLASSNHPEIADVLNCAADDLADMSLSARMELEQAKDREMAEFRANRR